MNHYTIEIDSTQNTHLVINNSYIRTDHYDKIITLVMMRIQPEDQITIINHSIGMTFNVDWIYFINFWMELKG